MPPFPTTTPVFSDVPVIRHTYKCTKGNACLYTPVASLTYTEINFGFETRITELKDRIKAVSIRKTVITYVISLTLKNVSKSILTNILIYLGSLKEFIGNFAKKKHV